jgi:hypothetical protein
MEKTVKAVKKMALIAVIVLGIIVVGILLLSIADSFTLLFLLPFGTLFICYLIIFIASRVFERIKTLSRKRVVFIILYTLFLIPLVYVLIDPEIFTLEWWGISLSFGH